MDPIWLTISFLVVLAYVVQTATGFGAGLVLLTTGSMLVPIPELIAVMMPLSIAQTAWISWKHRSEIDWRYLFFQIMPLMGSAMVLTFWWTVDVPPDKLVPLFGALVLLLTLREFWVMARGKPQGPVSAPAGVAALLGAGVVHGIYATGGPLVVWAAARRGYGKARFRATITALWLLINLVLIVQIALVGRYTEAVFTQLLTVVWGLPLGIWLGEHIFARVDERLFRRALFGLLGVAAVVLILK